MIVFAFAKQPRFIKSDFFGGGVFGFIETGEEDRILAKFIVNGVYGMTELGIVFGWFEERRGCFRSLFEIVESNADFCWLREVTVAPEAFDSRSEGDGILSGRDSGFRMPGSYSSGYGN